VLAALPGGYETRLGSGGRRLSGGERRRLAIARALVRDTPVLVLDEPTTGLDEAARDALLAPLQHLVRGRTAIVITHDPVVVGWADRVLELRDEEAARHSGGRPGQRVMRPLGEGREIVPGTRVLARLHRSKGLGVYDAYNEPRACRVIVKTVRPDKLRDSKTRARLLREGRMLKRFTHPHLVRAYEIHDGDRPVVVMEALTGRTLDHLVSESARPLSAAELANLATHLPPRCATCTGRASCAWTSSRRTSSPSGDARR